MRNDFSISVSKEKYDDKNKIDWNKVKYQRIDDLSIDNIAELITEGYCFTSVFKRENFTVREKSEKNWKGTDFVVFDVDNVKNEITFNDYLKSLNYTPTIAYKTPNCNIKKSEDLRAYSRFRLLYAFETTITNKAIYQGIYDAINRTFDTTLFDDTKKSDNCGHSPVQQYSGNATKNCQIVINETIYKVSDFDIEERTEKPIKRDDVKVRIDDEFLQKLNTLKPSDFLSYYRERYQVIYETELDYNDDGYALTPTDYAVIQRNYTIYKEDGKIRSKYRRLKDGQGRRHTLFCNAKIRCQIKPSITVEELIYNLVYDRTHFFDNTDGVLSNQCLLRIALDAKKARYTMTLNNKPKFRTDIVYCMENHITPNALKMKVRKKLRYEEIATWYDTTKTIKQNLKYAEENNIKVSERTLYNFCYYMGINPKGEPKNKRTEPTEETKQNKAEISDISSVKNKGEEQHHKRQENATQRKYRPISLTEWIRTEECRKTQMIWRNFYAIRAAT